MSTVLEDARYDASGYRVYLLALYYLFKANFSLVVVVFGVVFVGLGATVIETVHPVFAAMFGLWGVSLIVMGVLAYTILWVNKMYVQISEGS